MSDDQSGESTEMTEQSATAEEIAEWDEEHDEPHPVFDVNHRPERKPLTFDGSGQRLVYVAIPKFLHFAHQYILQYVIEQGAAPITPYGITFWLLDTVDRDRIRDVNGTYVDRADEVWAFGTDNPAFGEYTREGVTVTDGVVAELDQADTDGTPVRMFAVDVNDQTITPAEGEATE